MKGMIFTEFLELVDDRFSFETTERLIEMSQLPSQGIYTAVGTYDPQEMVTLATNLSILTGTALPDLLREFGRHLFKRFLISFPAFFEGMTSSWEFLPKVQSYVHMEVLKLHPDAELPAFTCTIADPETLIMTYRSRRNLPDLAEGLILACVEYFDEPLTVTREAGSGEPSETRFILSPQRKPAHG